MHFSILVSPIWNNKHMDSSSAAQLPIPNLALTKGRHFCPASPAPAEVCAHAQSLSQEITAKSLVG